MEYILPKDHQTEINVIGAMLNSTQCLVDVLADAELDYFYHSDTKELYQTIAETFEKAGEQKVKRSVIEKKLNDRKLKALLEVADKQYQDYEGFQEDFTKLRNIYRNRQIYEVAHKALHAVTENVNAERTISYVSDKLTGLLHEESGTNVIDPQDAARNSLESFLQKRENPDLSYGMRFSCELKGKTIGFPGLDEVFHGAKPGDLFLIAAKTGVGKTALGCNFLRLFSLHQKYTGYYINTEMQIDELFARTVAPFAGVSVNELLTGQLEGTAEEIRKKEEDISSAHAIFYDSKTILSRIPTLTAQKVKALSKQVKLRYEKLDYIIVDYLGRMELNFSNGMQEYQIMFKNIQYLKELAIEMNIPVFVLAQRNDEGKLEGAKKIANECDGVLFFEPTDEEEDKKLLLAQFPPEKIHDRNGKLITNYKIVKQKMRRSNKTMPIFVHFNQERQVITEIS